MENPPHNPNFQYNNEDRIRTLRTALAARNRQISQLEVVIQELQEKQRKDYDELVERNPR